MCVKKLFSWFKKKGRKENTPQSQAPATVGIQDFVQASIVGIMSGIQGAQKKYSQGNKGYDPLICPNIRCRDRDNTRADKIYELEFDLALTVTREASSTTKGSAAVTVVGVYMGDLGFSAESVGSHSTVSRIKFKIPVHYPLEEVGNPNR